MKKKPGTKAFAAGIVLLALGLIATALVGLFLSTPIILGGIALLLFGLTATGRKAAGRSCVACRRTIAFEHDAEFCERCGRPVHGECVIEHRAKAHEQGAELR